MVLGTRPSIVFTFKFRIALLFFLAIIIFRNWLLIQNVHSAHSSGP